MIEENKLIAEFMGYTYFPHNHPELEGKYPSGWKTHVKAQQMLKFNQFTGYKYLCRNHNQLAYHLNWSWIMPVIEKIEQGNYGFKMCRKVVEIYYDDTKELILKTKEGSR